MADQAPAVRWRTVTLPTGKVVKVAVVRRKSAQKTDGKVTETRGTRR